MQAPSENPENQPLTMEGVMPQKKFYRSRAHCNPLSHNDAFDYPSHPNDMDWSGHYPKIESSSSSSISPNVLDIGCGFGGLTVALSTLLPSKIILGMEIRAKVTEYVRLRIIALRQEHDKSSETMTTHEVGDDVLSNEDLVQRAGPYQNCSVLRSNTMKHMPNFFHKSSVEKIFFCFPDPHFKKKNHCRRIVSEKLLSEYAYFLKPIVGRLYLITDVEELHKWHVQKCQSHPLFRELTQEEMDQDPCVKAMYSETEEGKKVERAGTKKYYIVFERLDDNSLNASSQITADTLWGEGEFGVFLSN